MPTPRQEHQDPADAYFLDKQRSGKTGFIRYDFDRIRSFSSRSSFFDAEQKQVLRESGMVPSSIHFDEYLNSVKNKLLVETSWASSVLEGNTYSLVDTAELIERSIPASSASAEDTLMILNHKQAIGYVVEHIKDISLSKQDILNVHALLANGLMKDPADVGRLRQKPVGIGKSDYMPLDIPHTIYEEFDALISEANQICDPFDQSFFLLANIAYLQAFNDVNKRTSRVIANIPLLKASVMPVSFYQISKAGYEKGILHYYETGDFRRLAKEYVQSYVVSSARFKDSLENRPSADELLFRVKHRDLIALIVESVVKNGVSVNALIPHDLDDRDKAFLSDHVVQVITGLNEGNALLYRLSAGDIESYRADASCRKQRNR